MKKFPLILFALLLIIGSGCKKSSSSNTTVNETSTEVTPVRSSLISGRWKITYFIKNGSNKTAEFALYKLTFNSNGVLTGANDIMADNGSWALTTDSGKTKLNINFASAPFFAELTANWEITSRSASRIVMQHTEGGSSQLDYLTIEKI